MPDPMRPRPTTPMVSTLRGFTSSSPAIFAAARSAKKTWRNAAACSDPRSARNVRRSSASPSANGRSRRQPHQPDGFAAAHSARGRAPAPCLLPRRSLRPSPLAPRMAPMRRRSVADQRARFRDGRRAQVAAFDPIHDAELQRLARGRDPAGRDQVDGGGDADQARQALRAAGAGHDAELHLGQRQGRRRAGDPAMASRAPPPGRRRAQRR